MRQTTLGPWPSGVCEISGYRGCWQHSESLPSPAIQHGTWTGGQRLGLVCGIGTLLPLGELLRRYHFDPAELSSSSRASTVIPTQETWRHSMPLREAGIVGTGGTAPYRAAHIPVPSASTVRWHPGLVGAALCSCAVLYQAQF